MIYKLDPKYVTRQKLKIISWGVGLILISLVVGYALLRTGNWEFLAAAYCIYLGVNEFQELRYWRANRHKIALEINSETISVSDIHQTRTLQINQLKKAVLQPIHGKIKSIVLHSSNGDIDKLQGFETMDEIANQLQNLLGKSKIKTARIFHR